MCFWLISLHRCNLGRSTLMDPVLSMWKNSVSCITLWVYQSQIPCTWRLLNTVCLNSFHTGGSKVKCVTNKPYLAHMFKWMREWGPPRSCYVMRHMGIKWRLCVHTKQLHRSCYCATDIWVLGHSYTNIVLLYLCVCGTSFRYIAAPELHK